MDPRSLIEDRVNLGTGVGINKRSSNAYYISMVCERFGRAPPLSNNVVQISKTKRCLCKFELLGVLSNKDQELDCKSRRENQKWIIGVLEGIHKHRF